MATTQVTLKHDGTDMTLTALTMSA